jgi:SOS response associated peptidase (SRAP)
LWEDRAAICSASGCLHEVYEFRHGRFHKVTSLQTSELQVTRLGKTDRLFNSFSEFNKAEGGDIWFAFDDTRPLAGIWTNWTSVRKVKEGETTNDLYAFLTTEPNAEVGAIHPKAMPVILTSPDEVETWMTAPADESPEAAATATGRIAPDRRPRGQGGSGVRRPERHEHLRLRP